MAMNFRTPYNRMKDSGEVNSGEIIVETAGYVSAERRITALMLAGQRLVESRMAEYDYGPNDDPDMLEDRYDPTRQPGYDLADAAQDAHAVSARLKSQKKQEPKSPAVQESKTEPAPQG